MSSRNRSSSRPTTTTTSAAYHHSPPAPSPPPSTNPNLTTTLYHTTIGLCALTWSHNLFGRSFHLHLLLHNPSDDDIDDDSLSLPSLSTPSFHLHIKPFIFWNKRGSKKLTVNKSPSPKSIHIHWDLSRAKFGSGPEPVSGFYIAIVVDSQMTLLVGDSPKQAYAKTKSTHPDKTQITVLRREHVYELGSKRYTTKACFGGKTREISIDCCRVGGDDSRLYFSIDNKRVLQVKHLKWKFRGNGRIEVDGVNVQVSWDVYDWLFEEERDDGYALFMFRFEKSGFEYRGDDQYLTQLNDRNGFGFGFGFETKKMKGGLLRTARSSSSSSSLSSASSSCGSVMEWESVEENELKGPSGFSLLVYAWKR